MDDWLYPNAIRSLQNHTTGKDLRQISILGEKLH